MSLECFGGWWREVCVRLASESIPWQELLTWTRMPKSQGFYFDGKDRIGEAALRFSCGPLERPGRGIPDLKSCNSAGGIENAEILQAVPSSEGDAFELTVSCQGG